MQAEDHRSGNRMHHVQRCLRDGFWRAADEQTSDTLPNATLLSSKPPANYFGFDPNRHRDERRLVQCGLHVRDALQHERVQWRACQALQDGAG